MFLVIFYLLTHYELIEQIGRNVRLRLFVFISSNKIPSFKKDFVFVLTLNLAAHLTNKMLNFQIC